MIGQQDDKPVRHFIDREIKDLARVRTNTKLKPSKKADLQVVKPVKTTRYSDIDLNNWKAYDHVKTDTLWEFPTRLKEGGHSNEYHGNYIPQILSLIHILMNMIPMLMSQAQKGENIDPRIMQTMMMDSMMSGFNNLNNNNNNNY